VTVQSNSAGYGPIPLVFGVTGHRDLIDYDIPELKKTVKQVIQAVQSRYPHSPLRLLSPLAEGADRLAAEVLLDLEEELDFEAELLVPLPMPAQEYERDFAASESRRKFRELLGRATQAFELPPAADVPGSSNSSPRSTRERQYEEVGIYVVRHSHFLLALWDGERGLPGGTDSIARFRVEGIPPKRLHPLDVPDVGVLFHIPARRRQNAPQTEEKTDQDQLLLARRQFFAQAWEKAGTRLEGTWERGTGIYATSGTDLYASCCPKDASFESFDRIIGRIDKFNQKTIEVNLDRAIRSSDRMPPAFDKPDKRILQAYCSADLLAVRSKASYRRALISIYWTAAGTGLMSFGVLNVPGFRLTSLMVAYALFFLATVTVFQVQKKKGWFDRYLEYRALAEGLRVQRFWQIAGLGRGDDRAEAFDMYLSKQVGEIGWIRESLRALSCRERLSNNAEARQFINQNWVKEQVDFFSGAVERDHLKRQRFNRISSVLYGAGLVPLLLIRGLTFASSTVLSTHKLFVMALRSMLVLPAFGALVSSYSRHLALDEQEKTYRRMARLFRLGKQKIEASGAEPDRLYYETIIRALGSEALRENADWLHLHSTHPVVSPYNIPKLSLPWWRKRKTDQESI